MNIMFYKPVITKKIRLTVFAVTVMLGLMIVVGGLFKTVSQKRFKAACTARTEGVVSCVYNRTDEEGNDLYCFNIRYIADTGQGYEFRTSYRSVKHEEGDKIAVYYDPADPGRCYSELYADLSGIHYCIVGGALILYGILFGTGLIKPRNG